MKLIEWYYVYFLSRRLMDNIFAAKDITKSTGRKERQASSKTQANTIENNFQPLQVRFLRKRQGQEERRTRKKKKCRQTTTPRTEESGNKGQEIRASS